MPASFGFSYEERENGDVVVRRHGQSVTSLRGEAAASFLDDVALGGDPQVLLASLAGIDVKAEEERRKRAERSDAAAAKAAKRSFPRKGESFGKEHSRRRRPN